MTTTDKSPGVIPADWVPGPKQGDWTYYYYAALLEDGQRYEIVDGVLYKMTPAPNVWQQKIALRIVRYLATHVEDTGLGEVFIAPTDVELAPNVVVQPDVFVLLNTGRAETTPSHIVGAPDLVVEVASPSTAKHDRVVKREAYARAGVKEYWLVDPTTRSLEVLLLDKGGYRSLGTCTGQQTLSSALLPTLVEINIEQIFA